MPAETPTAAQTLRRLLAGDPFTAPDCYSALTARVVEQVGFAAAYLGGHATGMMHYAIPDYGALTPTEMIDQASRVVEAVSIPIIADADQAGDSIVDAHRTVRRFERVGVAGIHIEDELTPKHAPFDGPLMPIIDMQALIETATAARRDDAFVIIARSDELHSESGGGSGALDEVIRRGIAYAEAGADVFLPTFANDEQIAEVAAAVPIPIGCYGVPIGPARIGLVTGWGVATAAREHQRLATILFEQGHLPEEAFDMPHKDELIGQPESDAVVTRWATRTGRPLRN